MAKVWLSMKDEALRTAVRDALLSLGHELASAAAAAELDLVDGDARDVVGERGLRPVVALAARIDRALCRAVPAAAYVHKPVVLRELAAAIEVALAQSQPQSTTSTPAIGEQLYKTTLRCIADAVITTNEDGHITFMNATAEELTGWSEAAAEGKALDDVFAVEHDVEGRSAEGGQPTLRLRPREGPQRLVEHNAAPIVEANGALHGIVVVFRDVTEKRKIEQRLSLSDRMASIGTLAAGIAHELNNPLAFVTSNLEFAIQELEKLAHEIHDVEDPDAAQREEWRASCVDAVEALREAGEGAARAAGIVRDMKVFVRGAEEHKSTIDVNRALSLAVRLTSNEIKHRAVLTTDLGDVKGVLADEGKLVQVFVNLLTNAVQALDEKTPGQVIAVTTTCDGNKVHVRVEDTGRGIPPEHVDKIFEPFFTTKPVGQGLGLGLAISHQIVTSFGGSIHVDSVAGHGTSVTVSLPVALAKGARAASTPPQAADEVRGRVLVVDDEALIGAAIRRILHKEKMEVVVESGGQAAFDRLARGEQYDVVLCDLMMPGFSGVDLYEGLAKTRPDLRSRVVFMTGNAFTARAHQLFETTSNVRIEKPFVPADLTRAIAEVMRRHRA